MSEGHPDLARFMASGKMASPAVPLHIHALGAVFSHYQIHTLHLDPVSLVLLSAFVFLCEAFVGVAPSVALLRHFFSLESISAEQCSGCVSLKAADTSSGSAPARKQRWLAAEEARERALSESPEADCRRTASDDRHRELRDLIANLEEQVQQWTAFRGSPTESFCACVGFRASVDSLALAEVEQSLEQERLEVRERHVSLGEECLASREAELQERVQKGVAEARRSLLLDYRAKLRL
ncbi:hypothetical protein D1007_05940 [Hordeum vulgare]|nr:hypothetical protein D1007_05940 [Hordeum vulgare]